MNILDNSMFKDVDFEYLNNISYNILNKETIVFKKEDTTNPYKETYVLKKGRAREKQLKQMSNKERAKEKLRMKERNRLSAESYRKKRKKYTENLKTKVIEYEKKIKKQNIEIELLNLKVLQYQKIIENEL